MQRFLFATLLLSSALVSTADAQLMFNTTFDKYEYSKGEWESWSTTKPGDFVEYSDGTRVFVRFEALEVGDHSIKLRMTHNDGFRPKPEVREILHVFTKDEPSIAKPTSVTDDKLKLGDTEFAAKRWDYQAGGQLIKEVWYSDDVPFDGMLKYQQYTLGQPSAERVVARFRKGEKTFGKVDDAPAPMTTETRTPEPPSATSTPDKPMETEKPEAPAASDDGTRTWTSADGKQTIEATIVRTTPTGVVLKRKGDGKVFNLALKQLSQADRDYLKELRKAQKR